MEILHFPESVVNVSYKENLSGIFVSNISFGEGVAVGVGVKVGVDVDVAVKVGVQVLVGVEVAVGVGGFSGFDAQPTRKKAKMQKIREYSFMICLLYFLW